MAAPILPTQDPTPEMTLDRDMTPEGDWRQCLPLTVLGALSGTSVDAIDVACVEIRPSLSVATPLSVRVLVADSLPYSSDLRQKILEVAGGAPITLPQLSQLDDEIAAAFARAILDLTTQSPTPIDLIGSHGQTVFHKAADASSPLGHSIQLGRGETIATLTGLPTVSDFRAADIALQGHGAPLVPRIDALLLRDIHEDRCIQNIGGIGNVTYLPALQSNRAIVGWDTGPGNLLLDLAAERLSGGQLSYDNNGDWAARGTPNTQLIERWLQGEFFHLPPPKSTGRELFSAAYLERCLVDCEAVSLSSADIMATLTDLTAASIVDSYRQFLPALPARVAICGGGARNIHLMQRLQAHFDPIPVVSTATLGVDPDFKEAIAFAVLAYLRVHLIPGNLPSVTGAADWCLLGTVHAGKKAQNIAK